jgi:hypothetical protein
MKVIAGFLWGLKTVEAKKVERKKTAGVRRFAESDALGFAKVSYQKRVRSK